MLVDGWHSCEWQEARLWGVTSTDGNHSAGTIFYFDAERRVFTKVDDFDGEGGYPFASLSLINEKLWGMTVGTDNHQRAGRHGILFNLKTDGSGFEKIHMFGGEDGSTPYGELIEHAGFIWGMTASRGAHNAGIIFKINPAQSTFTKVHDFDVENGRFPEGNLLESNQQLWGLTRFGGANDKGVIFYLRQDGSGFTKVFDFDEGTGGVPYGSLVEVPEAGQ